MATQSWGSTPVQRAGQGMDWGNLNLVNQNDLGQLPMGAAPSSLSMIPQVSAGPAQGGGMFGGVGDWFNNSGFLGKKMANGDQTQGWGMPVIGALQGLSSAYLGFQQLKLAKDAASEGKRQFNMNWDAQQKTVNSRLEDRQKARVASNPGAYSSVSDYMQKNGI